eukprot:Selendium_serpulae@DN6481_c0_g3_i2.p1
MMNIYLAEQQLSAIIKPQKKLILQRPASTEHGWPGHRLRQPSLVCCSTAGSSVSVDSHLEQKNAEQQLSAIVQPQKTLILQRPASTEHGWPGHRLRQPSLVCRSTAGGTVSMDSHRLEFCVVILVVTIRTVRGVHTVAVVGYVQV